MRRSTIVILALIFCAILVLNLAAYPPAVGILGKSKDCLACHVDNGPWGTEGNIIIDVVDKQTRQSLRQSDGSFLIQAKRGELKTVLTVIGSKREGRTEAPTRNAWLYVDPEMISASALSCFAPGWNVNLPMACRVMGDKWDESIDADFTVLPMSVRPTDAARDASLELQVMVTMGESVKGKAKEGLIANYFERKVTLMVIE
jgi:hypothetical protein